MYKLSINKFFINSKLPNSNLKDICTLKTSSLSLNDIENNDGIYPIYGANGFIKNINNYQINEEYVAIVKDGSGVGKCFVCQQKSSFIGTLNCLVPKINVHYFNEIILSINFTKYIVGSGIPHIYYKDYCNERIYLHNEKDRNNIGELFYLLIDKINQEYEKYNKLIEFKKGLMQQLFV